MANKNSDIIELVIKGQDEYSDISQDVRDELIKLREESRKAGEELADLEKALQLRDDYEKFERAVEDSASALAKAEVAVKELTQAKKEAKGVDEALNKELNKAKADVKAYRKEYNEADKQFRATQKSLKNIPQSLHEITLQQDEMRQSASQLQERLKTLRQEQRELAESGIKKAESDRYQTEQAKKLSSVLGELARTTEVKRKEDEAARQLAEKNAQATQKLASEVDRLNEDIRKGRKSISEYTDEMKALGRQYDVQAKDVTTLLDANRKQAKAMAEEQKARKKLAADLRKQRSEERKAASEKKAELSELIAKERELVAAERKSIAQKAEYTAKVREQIAALRKGAVSWEDYRAKIKEAAIQIGIASTESNKIIANLGEQARAARDAARADAKASKERAKSLRDITKKTEGLRASITKLRETQKQEAAETAKRVADRKALAAAMERELALVEKGEVEWTDYQRRIKNLAQSMGILKDDITAVNIALEKQVTAARAGSEAVKKQRTESERTAKAVTKYRIELEKLTQEYHDGKISLDQFTTKQRHLRESLNLTEKEVKEARREVEKYAASLKTIPGRNNAATKSTDALTHATRRIAQAYTAFLAVQKAVQLTAKGVTAYSDQESALLNVAKTTNLAATELTGLKQRLEELSGGVTQASTQELLDIAAAAGRMGIEGASNLTEFTKSINALSSATGLAGEDTAQALAQIMNVTGTAQEEIAAVASTVAHLGNTSAATEEKIVHFGKRLASDTASMNLSAQEVLGMAAAFSEMGIQAEGGSSVVGRTFREIEAAVQAGGESLEVYAGYVGMTGEELVKAFGEDKMAVFQRFVAGIGQAQDSGKSLSQILGELGLKSTENARILGLLSKRGELLAKGLDNANEAYGTMDAHFVEMAKKEAALSNGFSRLQNRIDNLAAKFGEAFSDDLVTAIDRTGVSSTELDAAWAEMGETLADVIQEAAGFLEAFDGLTDIIGTATGGLDAFDIMVAGVEISLNSITGVINMMVGGIAELAIQWNKFFGDTDDVKEWEEVQNRAFERLAESQERFANTIERLSGDSSRAFQDMKKAYEDNAGSLDKLDEKQKAAIENMIKNIGYVEGSDAVYRDLTRSIQRAAAEKQILEKLTSEENAQLQTNIALLVAQGESVERATELAKAEMEASLAAAKAKEEAHQQEIKDREALKELVAEQIAQEQKLKEQAEEALEAQREAYEALGLNFEEANNLITEGTQKSLDALQVLSESGSATGDIIATALINAFDKVKTEADIQALVDKVKELKAEGQISGQVLHDAMELARAKTKELKDEAKEAGTGMKNLAKTAKDATKNAKEAGKASKESGAETKVAMDASEESVQKLIDAIKELAEAFKKAADEAEEMGDKTEEAAEKGEKASKGEKSSGKKSSGTRYVSMTESNAQKLEAQGRSDAADILRKMGANGELGNRNVNSVQGVIRHWEKMIAEATRRADKIQGKKDEFDQLERAVAAGSVSAAKSMIGMRDRFPEVEQQRIMAAVAAANAMLSKETEKEFRNSTTSGGNVTINFQINGSPIGGGQFSDQDAEAMIQAIGQYARISR